jgi:hypothetical protein
VEIAVPMSEDSVRKKEEEMMKEDKMTGDVMIETEIAIETEIEIEIETESVIGTEGATETVAAVEEQKVVVAVIMDHQVAVAVAILTGHQAEVTETGRGIETEKIKEIEMIESVRVPGHQVTVALAVGIRYCGY